MANTKIPVELSSTPSIVDNGNATAITIDSSENVGIGTDSPSHDLTIQKSGQDNYIRIGSNSDGYDAGVYFGTNADWSIGVDNSNSNAFSIASGSTVGTNPRVTIDSSGNLLVGKTATGGNTAGMQIIAGSFFSHVRDGGVVQILNRKTDDGFILQFEKDNSTVGSIGVTAGSIAFGQSNTGLGAFNGDRILFPATSSGAVQDNAIDLGYSGGRFKDLYLSGKAKTVGADFSGQVQHLAGNVSTYFRADNARYGQIFMDINAFNIRGWTGSAEPIKINAAASGGPILLQSASTTKVRIDGDGLKFNSDTAAANALDDYEEGTWNPSFQSDLTTTYTTRVGTYTKVGNLVTAWFHIDINVNGASSSQSLIIAGLPFAAINTTENYGVVTGLHCNVWATSTKPDHALISPGTNVANLYKTNGQAGLQIPTHADIGGGNMLGVLIYRAA